MHRQGDGEYESFAAQDKALARRRIPRRVSKFTAENEPWVDQEIEEDYSSDVIAERARQNWEGRRPIAGTIDKIIENHRWGSRLSERRHPKQGGKERKTPTGPPGKGRIRVL